MEFHELANNLPMLPEAELQELANDIKANGLHHPIVTLDGKILDGRNRYVACELAGVKPAFEKYTGNDPIAFVISENIKRRHLNESQRAMFGARLANMPEGHPTSSIELVSQDDAATKLNISVPSIKRAKTVIEQGTPALVATVDAGQVAVSVAAKIAKASKAAQNKIAKKIKAGIKPQEAQRQVLAESFKDAPMLPQDKKYRVIYADPPWSYGNTSIDEMGEQRDHYPVMELKDICALPVKNLSEDNAVLFLWVTSPILKEAFDVISAWGFEYKASFVWDKVKHVMGHYNSVRHEFLLVCVRGSCQPDERKLFDSVVTEERAEHSKKPETFRGIIETLYTAGNRIELFARENHAGWDTYGNETSCLPGQS